MESIDFKIIVKDTTLIKTFDYKLNEEIKNVKEIKMPISYEVTAIVNKPLKIKMTHLNITSTYIGNIVTKAINNPLTNESIKEHLSKIGFSPFITQDIKITSSNNIFIRIKELNDAKRYLINTIIKEKTKVKRDKMIKIIVNKPIYNDKKEISAFVSNEEQLKYLIDKIDYLYTEDFNLYQKYKCHKVYYRLNRYSYQLPDYKNENLLVTTLGQVYKYHKNNNIITDYTLNITNSFSYDLLKEYNVKKITASVESKEELYNFRGNIDVLVYGKIENMILNYCLIKENLGCKYCKHNIKIKNNENQEFTVIGNNCHNKILNYKPVNKLNNLPNTNIRLDFYDESLKEINDILKEVGIN